jgi:glycerophosphoryl diester phosphodiesterase
METIGRCWLYFPMLVLSHRGYHKNLPENTLDAFQAALSLGVDGIETDGRLSRVGELVFCHDRVSPDSRKVDRRKALWKRS